MAFSDFASFLALIVVLAVPIVLYAARSLLVAYLVNGVQHGFNIKLEELRTEIRGNEERLKSELRDKEAQIALLRNSVLSGSASRRLMLDKRRFEAVEKIWTSVNDITALKNVAATMSVLKFKAMSAEADDPRLQKVFSILGAGVPELDQIPKDIARDERPFVPEIVWAYLSAYRLILLSSYHRFMMLKKGVRDSHKFLNDDGIRKIVKAVLPAATEFVDTNEPEQFYYLLEHIEQLLLIELRKVLDGKETDEAAAQRAADIMSTIVAVTDQAKQTA